MEPSFCDQIISPSAHHHHNNTMSGGSSSSKKHTTVKTSASNNNNNNNPRSRKKGQFKLRFHHQALPQEYLDHYEASQKLVHSAQSPTSLSMKFPSVLDTPESPQDRTNENIRNWLQKISELQNEGVAMTPTTDDCVHLPSTTAALPLKLNTSSQMSYKAPAASTPSPSTSKVVNYNDLPFMGEMTLDNCKPRRGRKPKKADICHLIYKNYGTIFPGTPADLMDTTTAGGVTPAITKTSKKMEVQNKISSLLEKRLTVKGGDLAAARKPQPPTIKNGKEEVMVVKLKDPEPLNLCLRDTLLDDKDSLTVSSEEGVDPDDDEELDEELAKNLKLVLPSISTPLMLDSTPHPFLMSPQTSLTTPPGASTGGWPEDNNLWIYYQKILEANATKLNNNNNHLNTQPPGGSTNNRLKTPKPETPSRPGTASSASSFNSNKPSPSSTNTNGQPMQKRKRSAIFIPPMPLEASNPATEVSICKFKFTGGAKPSLQEKKMLSVDSGGNFRYYSGTGDKSMRGYEFFPREKLQQSALVAGSSAAGAFLNAHGEKMDVDVAQQHLALTVPQLTTPSAASSPQEGIVVVPENNNNNKFNPNSLIHLNHKLFPFGVMSSTAAGTTTTTPIVQRLQLQQQQHPLVMNPQDQSVNSASLQHQFEQQPPPIVNHPGNSSPLDRRKRKSRRSIQREKLEKTFKEKGFLIQTQQTESAGATYCKFRQLKKFTRYLFRSWKNYLPGDLQQQQQQLQAQHQQVDTNGGGNQLEHH